MISYAEVKLQRAYCEGRQAARQGQLVSDDPFAELDRDCALAWLSGYGSWGDGAVMAADECADLPHHDAVPVPTLVYGQVVSNTTMALMFSDCVNVDPTKVSGSVRHKVGTDPWSGCQRLIESNDERRVFLFEMSSWADAGVLVEATYDTGAPFPVEGITSCETGLDIGDQAAITLDNPLTVGVIHV
jgi:hypothetical protein